MTSRQAVEFIRAHRGAIQRDIEAGDVLAKNIASLWSMCSSFPDKGSVALLVCAVEDWAKKKAKECD